MTLSKTDSNYVVLWLFASLLACLPALGLLSASYVDGVFIPASNDSLYHARRILDVAVEGVPFYEFDPYIHAPEGSQLTWPWGYDYLMAQALKFGLWLSPGMEPMKFLAYVPTTWLLVNMGLFIALARRCGLDLALAVPAAFGFALLPLNQLLHGVGVIDHHFMELTFVLLSAWSAIRYVEQPSRGSGLLLGAALGLAPVMHTSLFILQIPVLAGFGLMWIRGCMPSREAIAPVVIGLMAASIAIALPSDPVHQLAFEYTTLSVFHVYVAACTSIMLLALSGLAFSGRGLGIAAGVAFVLALPLAAQVLIGANYIAGGQISLDEITEVRSPWQLWERAGSHTGMTRYYSFLAFLTPVMLAVFALMAWTARSATEIMRNVAIVFGAAMLLTQFRFHPFGSWTLLVAPALLFQMWTQRVELKTAIVAGVALVGMLMMFVTPIRFILFARFPPGMVTEYAVVHPIFETVKEVCDEAPGIMLGVQDDGHAIRFHSECSVIANNFLLTPQHGQKILQLRGLLGLEPAALLDVQPTVDYVLVHLYGLYESSADGPVPRSVDELRSLNPPLFNRLALDGDVPPGFELVRELRLDDERELPYVQLYRINR